MKKLIALLLCIMMLISIVSFASAVAVSKTLTSTSEYVNTLNPGVYPTKSSDKTKWNAPFYGASSTQRVVVRIYQLGGDVVSSTWVYSDYSTTAHPYKSGVADKSMQVFMGAKVDDRDEGPITISGSFNPNRN